MQAESTSVKFLAPDSYAAKGIRIDFDCFRTQLIVLACLSLFSSIVLAGHFLATRTLYWDNLRLYSFFHDNLHSLNYFGEIQWWSPHAPDGFPSYYLSILGNTNSTPLFVLTGFLAWLLGVVGIHITSYIRLYILYFGFLVPFLFGLGFLLLARQVISDGRAVVFTLILACFAPGVVFNLSDAGFEMTVYSVFFAAAWLNLLQNPGRRSFLLAVLSAASMAVSLNHISLYWNVIFVPLFIAATLFFRLEGSARTERKVAASVPRSWLIAVPVLLLLCTLPSLFVYTQGPDLLRTSIGKRVYGFEDLRAGNPLEVMAVSTPGIGFEWTDGLRAGHSVQGAQFFPFITTTMERHTSYGYLGLLSLPLVFLGLVFGVPVWRRRLLFLIAAMSTVVILSGHSPLFAGLLALPTPLRAVNHYSDISFRMGTFLLLILAAGLGAEAVLGRHRTHRRWFLPAFAMSSAFSMGLFLVVFFLYLQPASVLSLRIFGFMTIMTLLLAVVAAWFSRTGSRRKRKIIFGWLLALTLVDVSTVSFGHVRSMMWGQNPPIQDPPIRTLGAGGDWGSFYLMTLLTPRSILELRNAGVDPENIPYYAFSLSARTALHSPEIFDRDSGELPYIVLPEELRGRKGYRRFFREPDPEQRTGAVILNERSTYNHLTFEIESGQDALFFWRDLYSPFWTATVNGNPVYPARAFGAFKAIPVPAGRSVVEYRFSPGLLPWALAAGWLALLLVASAAIFHLRRSGAQEGSTGEE